MHGLERIDAFVYDDIAMPALSVDEPWIDCLFGLQHGNNGLRDLRINVYPITRTLMETGQPHFEPPLEDSPRTERLNESLQDMIKRRAETYTWVTNTVVDNQTPGES